MPITSSDAERLRITLAPATALYELGGIGVHRSSHSSMAILAEPLLIIISVPKGMSVVSAIVIEPALHSDAEANQRHS